MRVDRAGDAGVPVVKLLLGGPTWHPMSISLWSTRSLLGEIFVLMDPTASSILGPRRISRRRCRFPSTRFASGYVDFDRGHYRLERRNAGTQVDCSRRRVITLFTNQTDAGGNTIAVRGISGANVGVNNGFLVGTTFTDSAARSIVDISPTGGRGAAAPYVGDFRVENDGFVSDPDGRTLTAFLNKVLADGAINGTWKLETIDTTTTAPSTPASVDFWTLNLSYGHEARS